MSIFNYQPQLLVYKRQGILREQTNFPILTYFSCMHAWLHPFTRSQNKGRFIPEIDGLRGLAIIAVVISHLNMQVIKASGLDETFLYSQPLSRFLELCGYGVNIFFCISGFILVLPFAQHYLQQAAPVHLGKYYLRRITRLEIPYLLVLTALFAMQVGFMQQKLQEELPHYISSFFYSHNLVFGRRSTINPVAWTLEIEIQFYLILPLLAKLFKIQQATIRRTVLGIAIVLCTFLCNQTYPWLEAHHLQYSLLVYLPIFLIGILLADIYMHHQLQYNAHVAFDVCALLGFIGIVYQAGSHSNPIEQSLEYASYFMLFIGALNGYYAQKFFTQQWLMTTGIICYSIYLLHYAFIYVFINYGSYRWLGSNYYANISIQSAVVLPIIALASLLFYWFIEKRFTTKK